MGRRLVTCGLVALLACNGQVEPNDAAPGDAASGDAPIADAHHDVVPPHRTSGVCTVVPGPGSPSSAATSGCMSDSECDAGLNGRCYIDYVCEDGGTPPFCPKIVVNDCRYDDCMADTACGDAACTCREDFPKYTGMNDTCASTFGNCRVDTDCPNEHYCSPSWVPGCFPPAYFCHTSQDECVIDDDCLGETSAFNRTCGFDPQKNHWACMAGCYDGGSGN